VNRAQLDSTQTSLANDAAESWILSGGRGPRCVHAAARRTIARVGMIGFRQAQALGGRSIPVGGLASTAERFTFSFTEWSVGPR
jgi:hypothetical protein